MPTPQELAVDLHDLWFTSKSLDEMAGAHFDARGAVSGCNPASAFTRPDLIGTGGTNGINEDWVALRDQIVAMLGTNGTSLRDTATAMRSCIKIYTGSDEDVRQAFERRQQEIPYE